MAEPNVNEAAQQPVDDNKSEGAEQQTQSADKQTPTDEPQQQQQSVQDDSGLSADQTGVDGRMRRDNAALRQTMIKLGIDPDSSDAEALREGYLDPKEYMTAKYGIGQSQAQPAVTEQEKTSDELVAEIDKMVNSVNGQVSVDQYQQIERLKLDLNKKLIAENAQLRNENQQTQTQRIIDDCMSTCRNTYQSDQSFSSLPAEAQTFGAQLIESATDRALGQLATQLGGIDRVTPQMSANETAKVLQEFKNFVASVGSTQAAPQPTPQPQNVAPVTMGQGSGQPISTPRPKMGIRDIQANAEKYLATQKGQV